MNTDNSVMRAKEEGPGAGWKKAKGANMRVSPTVSTIKFLKKLVYDFYAKKSNSLPCIR